jgi:hypothetical protein
MGDHRYFAPTAKWGERRKKAGHQKQVFFCWLTVKVLQSG